MAAASSRQQLSSIQMRRPREIVRGGKFMEDRHRKKVGECVQVLLEVCKLCVPVPKTSKICSLHY